MGAVLLLRFAANVALLMCPWVVLTTLDAGARAGAGEPQF